MINDLIKDSIKSNDKIMTEAYRSVKSKMLLEQKKGGEAPDEALLFVESVKREIRERVESNSFIKDQNSEEYQKNARVISVLESHLPKKLSEAEQLKLIEQAIKDAGAKDQKDLGKVVKFLAPHKETLDMKFATDKIRSLLTPAG